MQFFFHPQCVGGKTSVPFYQHHQAQVYSWFGWFNPSAEQIHLTCHPNLPTNCHQYTYIVIFSQSIFFFISYIYTYMHAPKKEWEAVRSFGQGDGWWSCQGARLVRHRGAGSGGMMCFFANGINRHGEIMVIECNWYIVINMVILMVYHNNITNNLTYIWLVWNS